MPPEENKVTEEAAAAEKSADTGTDDSSETQESLIGGKPEESGSEGGGEAEATGAEAVDISIPDGVEVNQESLTEFKDAAQVLGLKSDGAQKLYDLYLKERVMSLEAEEKEFKEQQQKWIQDVKSDEEIGGADYLAKAKNANAALHRLASKGFMELVSNLGINNHPELVRLGHKIHTLLAEDTVTGAKAAATVVDSAEAKLRKEYPSMFLDQQ